MKSRYLASSIVALAALVGLCLPPSAYALALPLGIPTDGASLRIAPNDSDLTNVDFTAIVALSNCSGSLVRFVNSAPTDKAHILTNGHCFEGGFIDAGTAIVNRASTRTFRLLSSDATRTLATLRASKVLYATMTGTDITLYELTSTYADIQSRYGVEALTIANQRPETAMPITIVSGYWKTIYSCSVDNFIYHLQEGQWTFTDSIRYLQPGCETIGGTSGSPVIHSETREVMAINNTGNEDGESCTLNNPCEVNDAGDVTATRGAAYGQQTYILYACLTNTNEIDLTLPGCQLTRPATLSH